MNSLGNKQIMAENIRYYMRLRGKSRTDVCKAVDVKYTTFCDWINAKTYPRIDRIEMMARYFNCQKSDLVEQREPDAERKNTEAAKVALFGGASEVTDEMWEEVLEFARYVEAREAKKKGEQ